MGVAEVIIANTFAAMHAEPELTLDAIEIIRRHFAGPIGVYAETGGQASPGAAG